MQDRKKIWGGPGCGKTASLMAMYLKVQAEGYGTDDITMTTYRKSSAMDMISEVVRNTGAKENELRRHVGTIHSICYRLIGHPEMIKEDEIRKFLKEYGYMKYTRNTAMIDDPEEKISSGDLLEFYAWLRNTQTPLNKVYRYPGFSNLLIPHEKIEDFVNDYDRYKEKIGKIDFSDMPEMVLKNCIPLDTPVLFADEFQDFTKQLFDVFEMWSKACDIVVIAGDPLQSIYGYAGGSPNFYMDWNAKEYVLKFSHRLRVPVWNYAQAILKREGMETPKINARDSEGSHIVNASWGDTMPVYDSELHLVRCNYQKLAVAQKLASEGKLFGGLCGWTKAETDIFNTILKYRSSCMLSGSDIETLFKYYPAKLFNYSGTKTDFVESLKKGQYQNQLNTGAGVLSSTLCDILQSGNPVSVVNYGGKLFQTKIDCMLNVRDTPILPGETRKRRIMTIHASKGLEADAVFLHSAITPKIEKQVVLPCKESEEEARVWYVGATRAREKLYLIHDAGKTYGLPGVTAC